MTWKAYHRLTDIYKYLDYLATTYPALCSVQTIGKSHGNRDLKVLKISNGDVSNKAIWINSGIHAREWISPATVTYIIDQIVENWEEQPEQIRKANWYILPVANPDGYEYTHTNDRLWRKNRKWGYCWGVDLNRNFGYKWGGKGSSRNKCSQVYAGQSAFSEPENKAVRDFLSNLAANFTLFLSFHSYGQYIIYPWSYDKVVPPDHEDLQRVADEAADVN
jgi:carboxypeptidase A4